MTTIKAYQSMICILFLGFTQSVFSQSLMLSIPKNNSIYRGVDYEIELGFLGEKSHDFEVSLSKIGTIKKINSNRYVINSCMTGLLNILVKHKDSVYTKPLIVKNYDLLFSLLGHEGGNISLEELWKAEQLSCYPKEATVKTQCVITYFKFSVKRNNGNGFEAVNLENDGAMFSKSVKNYITTLGRGDTVMFQSIKAKCPCDDSDYSIGSMSFIIK